MSFILSPTAAGVGTTSVIATGDIASGATVIMNSDGTVTSAENVSNNNAITFGAATTIATGSTVVVCSVYDSSAKKIVTIYTTSSATYAIVGTVSGTSISYGTPVSIVAVKSGSLSGCFNTTNGTSVFTITHNGSGTYTAYAFTVSVSGTVPTIGTLYSYSALNVLYASIAYDSNANKCLIIYAEGVTSYATGIVATISGTTISYGTANVFYSSGIVDNTVSYDSTAKKLLAFYNVGNSSARANVATISGTDVTFGTQVTLSGVGYPSTPSAVYDPINNKSAVFFGSGSGNGYGVVATISGTDVSFGTPVVFATTSQNPGQTNAAYNTSISKIDLGYLNSSTSLSGYGVVATISGTSITFGNVTTLTFSTATYKATLAYDANSQKAVFSVAYTNGYSYIGSVGTATNLTTTNFFGISTSAASSGQSAVINTIGAINSKQTGLTAGTGYYVQNDGSLGTTAGTPSVYAGLATSATSILIKG